MGRKGIRLLLCVVQRKITPNSHEQAISFTVKNDTPFPMEQIHWATVPRRVVMVSIRDTNVEAVDCVMSGVDAGGELTAVS